LLKKSERKIYHNSTVFKRVFLVSRDFIGTIVLKVDPDDPKERLRRAKEIRNRGRDGGAADKKKSAKFVSTVLLPWTK
jgi:hypothetical protein